MEFSIPSNTQMIRGIPVGKLSDLDHRLSKIENEPTASPIAIETPNGVINSSNTVFTVSFVPLWITVAGIVYYEGYGYSLLNDTLTLDTAPTTGAILRSINVGVPVSIAAGYITDDLGNILTDDNGNRLTSN